MNNCRSSDSLSTWKRESSGMKTVSPAWAENAFMLSEKVKLPWRQTISPAPLIIKGFFREAGKEQSIPSELQMFSPFDNARSKWDKRSCWVSITDKITGCTENCLLS